MTLVWSDCVKLNFSFLFENYFSNNSVITTYISTIILQK